MRPGGDDRADRRAVARVRERAADIARRAGVRFDPDAVDPDDAGAALLAGFPDRLAARRRPGQFQLRNGTGAWVADDDPLATAPFVVAADLDGKRSGRPHPPRRRRRRSDDRRRCSPASSRTAGWSGTPTPTTSSSASSAASTPCASARSGAGRRRATRRRPRARRPGAGDQARRRCRGRRRPSSCGPGWRSCGRRSATPWPDLSDRALLATLDEWLAPYLAGATGRADLDRLDLGVLLRAQLPWPLGAELDELAPPTWPLPTGREAPIDYAAERPTVSVRVQDVFGVTAHPTVAGGRVPLTLALLSPADRPIQVTADLPGLLDRVVGRRPQGPRRPLPEAPLARRPRPRPTPAASRTADPAACRPESARASALDTSSVARLEGGVGLHDVPAVVRRTAGHGVGIDGQAVEDRRGPAGGCRRPSTAGSAPAA